MIILFIKIQGGEKNGYSKHRRKIENAKKKS